MYTIVTIDRQPGSNIVAVWLTNRDGLEAQHTNAVVLDMDTEPTAQEKLHWLTRGAVILITEGSALDDLPVTEPTLTLPDIAHLITETQSLHTRITKAVTAYAERTKSNLVMPNTHQVPEPEVTSPSQPAPLRTLFTANRMLHAWSAWLRMDDERRRRTVQPKTGITPWIMPAELNSPTVADFPPEFERRLHRQAET